MNHGILEALGEYIQAYVSRFNEIRTSLNNMQLPAQLYNVRIKQTLIFLASDGTAIFYLTEIPTRKLQAEDWLAGAKALPYAGTNTIAFYKIEETLSYLLQTSTLNYIKITLAPSKQMTCDDFQLTLHERIPPDIALEDMKGMPTLNIEPFHVRKPNEGLTLQGMVIGPFRHYEDGFFKEVVPGRNHIYSPVLQFENGVSLLQYRWPFLDLMWRPEHLELNSTTGASLAEFDLQILRLGIDTGFPQPSFPQAPTDYASRFLQNIYQQFEELINDPNTVEPQVQAFLELPGHQFLINPNYKEIFPRKSLGSKYITDFTIRKADDDYHFVEIESPNKSIFQKVGEEPANQLHHAITQVRDWLRYVEENRDTVRREDGLETIYKPTGEVIAGRDADLKSTIAQRRFESLRKEGPIIIRTYDMLLADIRAYIQVLQQSLNRSQR
ncbi:Shedu anti-phage system protein SduA domain-containing protein [Aggregatilinea lenta]|uniref:Shedu anti-phage system protein SduA domain-containing protein n=1 Tax=Aggregatilinea lenta TaxID=913108 RepID=UPI000E5B18DE|nr:Shedu anti-phage system protein SduA domain-containing protein [Aggregatilinea lenta]